MMTTPRLHLRRFTPADRDALRALNADPRVMRHFPGTLSAAESDAFAQHIEEHWQQHGFGLWAVELRATTEFIGFAGLLVPVFEAAFTPCVEIAWRLRAEHWNRGLATEAARAVVHHAFTQLNLRELIAVTVPANAASRRVMEKVGFHHNAADDFYHPRLPHGHHLRPHVLYRLRRI